MVIIDSLTDLVVSANIEIADLVAVLRGMQRVAKRWGGIIYLVLTTTCWTRRSRGCSWIRWTAPWSSNGAAT
jgi:hypothetical protein